MRPLDVLMLLFGFAAGLLLPPAVTSEQKKPELAALNVRVINTRDAQGSPVLAPTGALSAEGSA